MKSKKRFLKKTLESHVAMMLWNRKVIGKTNTLSIVFKDKHEEPNCLK